MKLKIIFILFSFQMLWANAREVIYYCSRSNIPGDTWQIYKRNLSNGITDTITNDPAYNFWKVELSPDHQELLILRSPASSMPDQENYENCEIIKANSDGSNQQVIVADNQYGWFAFGNPHWHPGGKRILMLAQSTDASAPWYLYTIDAFGNNPQQITTQWSIDPNWSPSGDKIAFVGITGNSVLDLEIFIADYDYSLNQVSNIIQLTADTTRNHDPCFSPDGTLLAFAAYDSVITNGDIVTITSTGSNRNVILDDNGIHGGVLNWGADGKIYHDNIYLYTSNWIASRYNTETSSDEILLTSPDYNYMHPYYADLNNTSVNILDDTDQQIKIFSKPSNQIINIEIPDRFQNYTIEIYSLSGQQIYKTSNQKIIDISNFISGIYILVLRQKNDTWSTKIQKQ